MYKIVDKVNGKIAIYDTKDGVIEWYSEDEVMKFHQMGIKIEGVKVDNERLWVKVVSTVGKEERAKYEFLGIKLVVFEPKDLNFIMEQDIQDVSGRDYDVKIINNSDTKTIEQFFSNFEAKSLDFSDFKIGSIESITWAFSGARLPKLNLSVIKGLGQVKFGDYAFQYARINELDIRGLHCSCHSMFSECKIQVLYTDDEKIREVAKSYNGVKKVIFKEL